MIIPFVGYISSRSERASRLDSKLTNMIAQPALSRLSLIPIIDRQSKEKVNEKTRRASETAISKL